MQKVFHILFIFLCVSTFEKVVREGKNMAFFLCYNNSYNIRYLKKYFRSSTQFLNKAMIFTMLLPQLKNRSDPESRLLPMFFLCIFSFSPPSHDKEQRKHIQYFFIAVFTRIHLLHLTACVALLQKIFEKVICVLEYELLPFERA